MRVAVQSDCYMEAFRLTAVRLRDGEEMGRRPPVPEDLDATRALMRSGWKAMVPIIADVQEARVLPEEVLALEPRQRVCLLYRVLRGRSSCDAVLHPLRCRVTTGLTSPSAA
jgi:hypothetical protein